MIQITGTFLGHDFEMLIDENYTPPVTPTLHPEPWGRGAVETPQYPTATDGAPDDIPPDDYPRNPNQGTPPADGSSA